MIRLSLTAAFAVTLTVPGAAHAQAGLSPADQQRVVCAPKRDRSGNKIGGEICMTGAQWQKALAKVPVNNRLAARSVRGGAGHLAYPTYFRANAWGPAPGNRW